MLIALHSYCSMGNELQEARSSEDDLEHPPTKKNKRDLAEDSHGKSFYFVLCSDTDSSSLCFRISYE